MRLIDGVLRSIERLIQVTWLEMASRRGTLARMRRDHEILRNFARTLGRASSSAPALRAANLGHVRERFEQQGRGMEHALYGPLREALPDLLGDLRERRSRVEDVLRRLDSTAPESEGFHALAVELSDALHALFLREAEDLFPAAIEHLAETDYQALEDRYGRHVGDALARQSA